MGENLSFDELIREKESILDDILLNIRSWDRTIESGISIIESNQELLGAIDSINARLSESGNSHHEEASCNYKLIMISKELEQLINWMKGLKKSILDEKKSLEKKEDIIKNYMANNSNPIFLDKKI